MKIWDKKTYTKPNNTISNTNHKKSTPTDLKQIENLPLFRNSNQIEVTTPSEEKPQTPVVPTLDSSDDSSDKFKTQPASFDTIKPSIKNDTSEDEIQSVVISDKPVTIDVECLELFNNPLQ